MKNLFKSIKFTTPSSIQEARLIQNELVKQLSLEDNFEKLNIIAGVDVGYDSKLNLAKASIVIMELKNLQIIEQVQAFAPATFPYVSGYLAFREIPAILEALAKLTILPDILMVDGQGIAHPRRIGIATHLGIILNIPSIGVGKSCLTGTFVEPSIYKGEMSDLIYKNEQIGIVLRSRNNTKPLFISPGNRITIKTAVDLILACLTKYRLPEPTRLADKLSKCRE